LPESVKRSSLIHIEKFSLEKIDFWCKVRRSARGKADEPVPCLVAANRKACSALTYAGEIMPEVVPPLKIKTEMKASQDWSAIDTKSYDGPESPVGYGKTCDEAILDLLEKMGCFE